jgi:hypothetical protein
MIDKAMSGWGPCRGKLNMYVIQCETGAQMARIERTASLRREMVQVHRRYMLPKDTAHRLVTLRQFHQVPGWHVDPVGRDA